MQAVLLQSEEPMVTLLQRGETGDAAADDGSGVTAALAREPDLGMRYRLPAGDECHLRIAVEQADIAFREMVLPEKRCDGCQALNAVIGELGRHHAEAAASRRQRTPERFDADAEGRHAAVARDDDAPRGLAISRGYRRQATSSTLSNSRILVEFDMRPTRFAGGYCG